MTSTPKQSISKMRLRAASASLTLAVLGFGLATQSMQAQSLTVLHTFTGGVDGEFPEATLVRDAEGNLYGTTVAGGAGDCVAEGYSGCGVIFRLDGDGKESILHRFQGHADGAYLNGLIRDASGNLYGTALNGGAYDAGTSFKLDNHNALTVTHNFSENRKDGLGPYAGLIMDARHNFYGTTMRGGYQCGGQGCGTVFKLSKNGKETVLYRFESAGNDGAYPQSPLVRDDEGNLYGTTFEGGGRSSGGTAFELTRGGEEIVLHRFSYAGGCLPSGLIRDRAGNFYGTTQNCGTSDYGIVFKLDKKGKETVLYSFGGGTDGRYPRAGLVRDKQGNLYGTTGSGGDTENGNVFRIDKAGKETTLYSFSGGSDGCYPVASLILDGSGRLYGTASACGTSGYGTVFELTP